MPLAGNTDSHAPWNVAGSRTAVGIAIAPNRSPTNGARVVQNRVRAPDIDTIGTSPATSHAADTAGPTALGTRAALNGRTLGNVDRCAREVGFEQDAGTVAAVAAVVGTSSGITAMSARPARDGAARYVHGRPAGRDVDAGTGVTPIAIAIARAGGRRSCDGPRTGIGGGAVHGHGRIYRGLIRPTVRMCRPRHP